MTITPNRSATRIAAARSMLDNLHARLPHAVAAALIGYHPGNDDRPKAEDAGIRGKGGHGDPTADAALAAARRREEHLDDLEQQLASLGLTIGLLVDFCDRWAPLVSDHPRCSGGGTVEPWTRPGCTSLVGYTRANGGGIHLRGDGLCDACRKRRDRWNRDQERREVA
jgi:hypothetical protein